jgi:single-strand DNA-binding protein
MLNKVMLIGNLGRDPEVRSTPSGQPVASFSVATNRKWKTREGDPREETEWHNIEVWGRQAEIAGQYLRRGSKVFVEGRIKTDSWDDKESGAKRYRTKIVCENFKMLDTRGDSAGGPRDTPPFPSEGPEDDDIPF